MTPTRLILIGNRFWPGVRSPKRAGPEWQEWAGKSKTGLLGLPRPQPEKAAAGGLGSLQGWREAHSGAAGRSGGGLDGDKKPGCFWSNG